MDEEEYKASDIDNAINDVEVEEEDELIQLMEKPFDPTKINIETKTPSLDTLIKRIIRDGLAMNTESYFQRKDDLWDKGKQSRLIESILIRFPLPAFFFDASNDDNWLIVDGLQRLSAIRNFCVNKDLKLSQLEFLTHLNGKTWNDLPDNLKRDIEETQIVIYKILPGTPTDVKFNIFKRINTGGLTLESQEIRHALFQGKPANFVAKLAETTEFKRATNYSINNRRMLDRDFTNRFLCFYLLGYQAYQSDLDTFMSKGMATINTLSDNQLYDIERQFKKAMTLANLIFGREAFRKVRGYYERLPPINKAMFDALSVQFAKLNSEDEKALLANKESFKVALQEELAQYSNFFTSVTSSTGDKKRVAYRQNRVKELIQDNIKY